MVAGLLEQRRRFLDSSLPAPELAQTHDAVRGHRRPGRGEFVSRRRQFALGLGPGAAPHANRRVLRAADGKQRTQAPFRAEGLEPRAPLRGALVVADAIAAGNHVARRQADGDEVLHLAGDDGRVHFVELVEAGDDLTGRDARQPAQRTRQQFEVATVRATRGRLAGVGVRLGARRIAILEERQGALAALEPGQLSAGWFTVEETPGALQPSVGDRGFATKRPAVPRDPHRHARRTGLVAALDEESIRAFARFEDEIGQVEPPGGGPQTLQRLGALAPGQRLLEGLARLGPRASCQGVIAASAVGWAFEHLIIMAVPSVVVAAQVVLF